MKISIWWILGNILMASILCFSAFGGDIGNIFCQNESQVSDHQAENCQGYVIGILDTLEILGYYCSDASTSYAFIIESWRRLIKSNTNLKSLPTAESMMITLEELGLKCPQTDPVVRAWKK